MSAASGVVAELPRHRTYLLRVARRHVHDIATAEDIVQETLFAALQSASTFEARASLRTWLTGILLRRVLDHRRRRARSPIVFMGDIAENFEDPDLPSNAGQSNAAAKVGGDPLQELAAREAVQALAAAVAELPDLSRRVFELREIEGMDNRLAAERLGIEPARVAVLRHRARVRLRERLQSS